MFKKKKKNKVNPEWAERGRHSQKQTEQHNVWLTAKWNKWHDVDDYCILVTQNTNKEVEKKTWIEIIPRLSHFSLHNRKDDSSEGYFSRHTKHANMFDANLLAWQPKLLADLFNLWL